MRAGFSLIELSVVLVIIGLLAGGVVIGQNLIKQAELRSITTDYQKYLTAANAFHDKYKGLPGDLRNATQYWGEVSPTPATCYTTVGVGTQTCNGNGDGMIFSADAGTTYSEIFRFWQHLAISGFIEGDFTGVAGGGGTIPNLQPIIGQNVPSAARTGTGFSAQYLGTYPSTNLNWFRGMYGQVFFIGSAIGNSTLGRGFPSEDIYGLDIKFDDGRPGTGNFMSQPNTNVTVPNCSTTSNENTAQYNLGTEGDICSLIIIWKKP